jgi:hypothetical protein
VAVARSYRGGRGVGAAHTGGSARRGGDRARRHARSLAAHDARVAAPAAPRAGGGGVRARRGLGRALPPAREGTRRAGLAPLPSGPPGGPPRSGRVLVQRAAVCDLCCWDPRACRWPAWMCRLACPAGGPPGVAPSAAAACGGGRGAAARAARRKGAGGPPPWRPAVVGGCGMRGAVAYAKRTSRRAQEVLAAPPRVTRLEAAAAASGRPPATAPRPGVGRHRARRR